jgi:peptide/nickel transport system ATP-binding protein
MTSQLLKAENIHGVYRSGTAELHAVDHVSLTLDEGEVLGLAGESGSGKSTLGSIISLIARPPLYVDDGTLAIDGKELALDGSQRIPRTWRGSVVSMLPQGAMNSISPTMRVRDLVVDVVKAHDRSVKKSEAIDLARDRFETLGLPVRALDAYPHQLSGGMKQRTVTVVSTLLNPRILIADEPTSALDVTSQKALIEMLQDMLEKKIMSGVIFITHDLPVLRTVSNRLSIMYRGKIVETGDTAEMVDDPQHPYTRALMGSVLVPEPQYRKLRIEGMKGFEDAPTTGRTS